MPVHIGVELNHFFISAFWGMLIIVYYDLFRLLRQMIHHSTWMVAVEDILFWIAVGCMVLAVSYKYDQGQIRGYLILGMLCGAVFYNWGLSPYLRGMILFFYKKGKEVLKNVTKQSTIEKNKQKKEGNHEESR